MKEDPRNAISLTLSHSENGLAMKLETAVYNGSVKTLPFFNNQGLI